MNNNTQFSGQFAIIQLTQINRQVTAGGTPYTQQSNGFVLDNPFGYDGVGSSTVTYGGNSGTGTIGPNTTAAVPPANFVQNANYPKVTGVVVDSPYLGYQQSDPPVTTWTKMSVQDSFQTYLAFQSIGGVWIGLSQIKWDISASVMNNNGTWKDTDLPPLPAAPETKNGDGQTSLIKWSGSASPSVKNDGGYGTWWSPQPGPPPQ